MTQLLPFVAGSALLLWLSRRPLRQPGSHGFYRFFAWECILGLVVINRPVWGEDPYSPHQFASWLLMLASIGLVIAGLVALRRHGGADRRRDDGSLYEWEKTGDLVTSGIYRWIRHPMYASLLALTWGAFLQSPGLVGTVLAIVGSLCLLATARSDERECLTHFGPAYADYMRRSKRFLPYLF